MTLNDPFHEGEQWMQAQVGDQVAGQRNAAAIGESIILGALKFIRQQPMIITGSLDANQDVWASALFGPPGFVTPVNDRQVTLDMAPAWSMPGDPLWANVAGNPSVGWLLIELASRRRLRINGRLTPAEAERWSLAVEQSYPNCPKYIQRRLVTVKVPAGANLAGANLAGANLVGANLVGANLVGANLVGANLAGAGDGALTEGVVLTDAQRAWISAADTFFVASAHPDRGVDASHRGGQPGFVQVVDERTLRIPDYVGNSMYNTLGNFHVHPRAGLLIVDFEGQRMLQMIGTPTIIFDADEPNDTTGGTRRYWTFTISKWRQAALPANVQTEFIDYSPHNPK